MATVQIRRAERKDCPQILKLLQELADFEKMPENVKLKSEDLERDGFDLSPPLFRCLVAENETCVIGYALFFNIYSTWTGKAMHLEDIYVTDAYRGQKIGSRLFRHVAKIAFEEQCSRLELMVLSWNPAREFYKKYGAVNLTESESWQYFRFDATAIKDIADSV